MLVQELISQGLIYEGATGEAARGRKPTFLHVKTKDRLAVAVDIRFSKTYLMLCDFSGRQLGLEIYDTVFSIPDFIKDLAFRIRKMLKGRGVEVVCEGIGVVVPGMVDQRTGRVLNAPALGWRGSISGQRSQQLRACRYMLKTRDGHARWPNCGLRKLKRMARALFMAVCLMALGQES